MPFPSSGVIPYTYADGTYPWRVNDPVNHPLGFSGIVFEQAQWVAIAEWRRFQATSSGEPVFQNYQVESGVPALGPYDRMNQVLGSRARYKYEPTPNGRIIANSGQIHTTDWIQDLRIALSGVDGTGPISEEGQLPFDSVPGVLENVSADVDVDYVQEWLHVKAGNTPGGRLPVSLRTWNHPYYTPFGIPPPTFLGGSGTLEDIDLNEVQYNPFTRFAKTQDVPIGEPTFFEDVHPVSPIWPNFAHINGTVVSANSRDLSFYPNNGLYYTHAHVNSGFVRIDGDVLLANTSYKIGNSTATFGTSGFRDVSNGFRPNAQPRVTRVFVTPPAKAEGVYTCSVSTPTHIIPSGGITSQFSGKLQNTTTVSGFEYFSDCIAVGVGDPTVGPVFENFQTEDNGGGLCFFSPLTMNPSWNRLAQCVFENGFGRPFAFCESHRFGSSIVSISGTAGAAVITGEFNNNLDLTAVHKTTNGTNNPAPVFRHICSDGSHFFVGTHVFGTIWELDESFNFVRFYNTNEATHDADAGFGTGPIVVANGGFVATAAREHQTTESTPASGYMGFTLTATGSIDGIPSGQITKGEWKPAFNLAGEHIDIMRWEEISSATSFNTGVWVLFGSPGVSTTDNLFEIVKMGRLQFGATEANIVEMYSRSSFNNTPIQNPNFIDINATSRSLIRMTVS